MRVLIATAERKLLDGEADSVRLPTVRGETLVLPGHTYLATTLEAGTVVVTTAGGEQRFEIAGGLAEICDERVVALAG